MRACVGLMTILSLGSVANAESFICSGSGKYAAVGTNAPVTVEWNNPQTSSSKVLMTENNTTVTFSIDKSNSGRSHYAEIHVMNQVNSTFSSTSAKGSIYDMVFLTEATGTQVSQIACLPNPVVVK